MRDRNADIFEPVVLRQSIGKAVRTTALGSASIEPILLRVPLTHPIADEDLIRINRRNPGWKIERGADGELEARLVGVGNGPSVSAELGRQIGNWRKRFDGGRFLGSSAAYNLLDENGNKRTRSPNVSWISQGRLDATPRDHLYRTGFPTLCPDFIIEVRSPYDRQADQHRRMEEWVHFGVQLAWLVDPIEGNVWIYSAGRATAVLSRPDELSGEPHLPGLAIDMTYVWSLVDEDKADDLS